MQWVKNLVVSQSKMTCLPAIQLGNRFHSIRIRCHLQPSEKRNGTMLCIAQAAAASPHVTAHMLASGEMETMLQQLTSSGAQETALLVRESDIGSGSSTCACRAACAAMFLVNLADCCLFCAAGCAGRGGGPPAG
jgi:hypothetical protein